jgi:phosphoribosylamine-glycine ligase
MERGIAIYFSGVREDPQRGLVTDGGRVLHIIAGDSTLEGAKEKAYRNMARISLLDHNNNNENCIRYRKGIGA